MRGLFLIGCSIALLCGNSVAGDHDKAYELLHSGEIISLEKILEISREHLQGHILEVELERENQQFIYEIELLDEMGASREIKLNATTGKIIHQK